MLIPNAYPEAKRVIMHNVWNYNILNTISNGKLTILL